MEYIYDLRTITVITTIVCTPIKCSEVFGIHCWYGALISLKDHCRSLLLRGYLICALSYCTYNGQIEFGLTSMILFKVR